MKEINIVLLIYGTPTFVWKLTCIKKKKEEREREKGNVQDRQRGDGLRWCTELQKQHKEYFLFVLVLGLLNKMRATCSPTGQASGSCE